MNLTKLKKEVDRAIEYAKECGESTDEIVISIQIDGPGVESVYSSTDMCLHYDNNFQASGCVITGVILDE